MRPSRVLGRTVLGRLVIVLTGSLVLSACVSNTTPPVGTPAASPRTATPSVSTLPSAVPLASTSPLPVETVQPSESADPTAEPTPEPTEYPGAAGPGCGTGRAGFFAHRDEVPEMLRFGGATIEFTTAAIGLRNETYWADDAIPAGIGLTPDELAVRVDPGTRILLRATDAKLTRVDVGVVSWSTVDFTGGLGSSPADPVELDWRLRADGAISIAAPTTSGDYMVAFHPIYETACLTGDGVAYGRIKVN